MYFMPRPVLKTHIKDGFILMHVYKIEHIALVECKGSTAVQGLSALKHSAVTPTAMHYVNNFNIIL
jgi:hypothetical protein